MYVKSSKLLFTSIFILSLAYARAATITITGPTLVCPGLSYTYTASASNIFGSKKGDFEWTFWRGNVLLETIGGLGCPTSPNNPSSTTVTFNWGNDLGDVKVRVRFRGNNDPGCYLNSSPDEKWLNVKVRVLSPGKISGLTFCSPNETRLVTVVPIPPINNESTCFYHYKYEWIVPSGWTIIPKNGNYTEINGGIRTGADSVWITAPSTLQPGFTGNYMVTVRTEEQWPWPTQSSGQVWVGAPKIEGTYAGGQQLQYAEVMNDEAIYNPICNYDYISTDMIISSESGTCAWQKVAANPSDVSWSQGNNNISFYLWATNQTAIFSAKSTNACGVTQKFYYFISISCSPYDEEPCNYYQVSPNPTSNEIVISEPNIYLPCSGALNVDGSEVPKEVNFIELISMDGERVYKSKGLGNSKKQKIYVSNFKRGYYILKIGNNKHVETHRIQLK